MQIYHYLLLCLVCSLWACQPPTTTEADAPEASTEISFYTSDSIQIFGDLFTTTPEQPLLLLFHQGGSNARGEYGPIIPRLLENGYNVLATDQRSGGQYYGSYNRTLTQIKGHNYDDGYGYCDAYNNLEAALDFALAQDITGPKFLWGSSYSASLAIKLAHERSEDIAGVLAFSPASGGPMAACRPDSLLTVLKAPLLLLRPPGEMQRESVQQQLMIAESYGHQTFAARHGVHGSSMLVQERVGDEVEPTWKAVLGFLESNTVPIANGD